MLAALFLCCMLIIPIGSNAAFNSSYAYNSNYRPVWLDKGWEEYVDVSSIYTIENSDKWWIFNVIEFSTPNDSEEILHQWTSKYKINKKNHKAYAYDKKHDTWNNIPMYGDLNRVNWYNFVIINYCYAYMNGHYLGDSNKMSAAEKWYKGN